MIWGFMMTEKMYFIVNPKAQNAQSLAVWNRVKVILDEEKADYDFYLTDYPMHASVLAKEILDKHDSACIIAIGGDGTAHEVANGVAEYPNATFSYIGAGSGNDFCRGAQIPMNPIEAIRFIRNKNRPVKKIDIGEYETDHKGYFLSSMGMGIDADVTAEVNDSPLKAFFNKVKLGKLAYLYTFFKSIATYKFPNMKVTIDGITKDYKKVWIVNIANQKYFGGGIPISPNARMDNGVFHVLIVHSYSRLSIFFMFFSIIWAGHIRLKNCDYVTGQKIQIESDVNKVIHADGEIVGAGKLQLRILPKQLNVICDL
ncbi:MAG: diacylglycerol kinase family lipid kinase [Bacillales bacterium]|jgi:YegS/Rv2252/BmrU family lipid kinase|nr:diacylglycerol kinase family lipid kinase [Bacillales bacterium]